MTELWTKENEIEFFNESNKFAAPEQLFYIGNDNRYYAYWPKSYKGEKSTLQSRNSLIGRFTEKYAVDLLQNFANSLGLYVVQSVICAEIGLAAQSPADLAFCKKKQRKQDAKDIIAIFEVKMSVVWNWELKNNELVCLGDYRSHRGNPGLLRSDSMLKAIGKSINIRVSSYNASKIPVIVLGNTPITKYYIQKVDHLFNSGIIQGFWSVNPEPLDDNSVDIKKTPDNGFIRMDSLDELTQKLEHTISKKQQFFSSMKSRKELGEIIEISSREPDFESKAVKFLSLIRS